MGTVHKHLVFFVRYKSRILLIVSADANYRVGTVPIFSFGFLLDYCGVKPAGDQDEENGPSENYHEIDANTENARSPLHHERTENIHHIG